MSTRANVCITEPKLLQLEFNFDNLPLVGQTVRFSHRDEEFFVIVREIGHEQDDTRIMTNLYCDAI